MAIAYRNKGYIYYSDYRNYDAALACFTEAIKIDPANADLYHCRGNVYRSLKNYDAALEDFLKAIERRPNNTSYYTECYLCYMKLKKYEEAKTYFMGALQKSLDLDSTEVIKRIIADVHINSGVNYVKLGKYEEAIADLTKAIETAECYDLVHRYRAFSYYKLKKYDEAVADLIKAIEINPLNSSEAYYNLGMLFHETKNYEDSITCYTRAIKGRPYSANLYYERGTVYKEIGEIEKAEKDFEKARQLGYKE